MKLSIVFLFPLSTLISLGSAHAAPTADEQTVQACTQAMQIEGQQEEYRGHDLTLLCPNTPYDLASWQCVVNAMQKDGYRLNRAQTLCGFPQ